MRKHVLNDQFRSLYGFLAAFKSFDAVLTKVLCLEEAFEAALPFFSLGLADLDDLLVWLRVSKLSRILAICLCSIGKRDFQTC